MKRREFLSQVAVISAGALLPVSSFGKAAVGKKKVLIAGAGISGLYCADLLREKGYDVKVLEASGRVGGKLMGGLVNGQRFDFGGQAVSKDMLRVKKLAKRFGLTMIPKPKQDPFYLRDSQLFAGEVLEALHKDFDVIEEKAKALFPQLDDPAIRKELGPKSVMEWARPYLRPEVVEYWRTSFAAEWCNTPEEVSLLHYLELTRAYDGEGEEMDFRYREGLYSVAEGLARELKGRIELNCPLENIHVGASGVKVLAGGGREFGADFLVSAIPVTVLKKIPIAGLDAQPLTDAIASFDGAAVRKVLAIYKKAFWGNLPREGAFSPPCGMALMDNSDVEKGIHCLAIFLGGPSALEQTGKEEVLRRVAALLGPEALNPLDYHDQAWLDSEQLCGGYGANRRAGRASYPVIPGQLGTRIFFSGSDVSDQFGSYVEGALASAERAANGISTVSRLASLSPFRAMLS